MPEKVSSQTITGSQQPTAFDDERTPMITTSELIEYLYCPRFTYFLNCLKIPQHEELRYKVLKGRELHAKEEKTNVDYIRKRLGCIKKEISVYLASTRLKIRGIVDEVLFLNDGTLAPLDYKLTEYNEFIYRTHRIQSTVYAMLIMENYGKPVKRGFVCYARSKNLIKELVYDEAGFETTKTIIDEIFAIILDGFYPKKTRWPNRCIDCCYRNICI
jgi:CRISPR-associated exonuclease Cas4